MSRNLSINILVTVPVGIGINLATNLLPVWISIVLLFLSGLIFILFLTKDNISHWNISRSKSAKQKKLKLLQSELLEAEKNVNDQRALIVSVTRIIITTIVTVAYFIMAFFTAIEITPFIQETSDNITSRISSPIFYLIAMTFYIVIFVMNIAKDLKKISNFEKFRDETNEKIKKLIDEINQFDNVKALSQPTDNQLL